MTNVVAPNLHEANAKHQQAIQQFNSSNREAAYNLIREAHALNPGDVGIVHTWGVICLNLGKADEAIQALSLACQLDSSSARPVVVLNEVLRSLGQLDRARALCLSFYERHPENKEIEALLVRCHGPWEKLADFVQIHPTAIISASAGLSIRTLPQKPEVLVKIGAHSQFFGNIGLEKLGARVSIGERTHIGSSSLIAAADITIGDDVLMAWGITLLDNDSHSLDWRERRNDVTQCGKDWIADPANFIKNKNWAPTRLEPIIIQDKVWVGFGSAILRGVTIGEGVVVGAHSVVTKDVPPYTVVAGNPARVIRDLPK